MASIKRFGRQQLAIAAALAANTASALATNGMNMEGYGPVSTGVAGAAQALDHGSAALMANPATIALGSDSPRLDLSIGVLGPRVSSEFGGMVAESDGRSYVMPSLGYLRRSGALTYGAGMFAQGGMGTEYGADTFLAAGSGRPVRSELGVGRIIFPVAYSLSQRASVAATLDYMWGTLDLRMAASGAQLGGMVTSATGNLGAALPALGGAPWARVDFSNDNKFSGAARASGWSGKVGFVFKATPTVAVGASHHFKSSLNDMRTGDTEATLSATGGFSDPGRITVIDFQWPSSTSIGLGWQARPDLLLLADVTYVNWAAVMKTFRMKFESAGMGGSVDFAIPQNWENETILKLGVAWQPSAAVTLRAGLNLNGNPVPDETLNPLFPATVRRQATLGLGWRFDSSDELNGSLTFAPTTTVTNASGVTISHRQINAQLMYSHRF